MLNISIDSDTAVVYNVETCGKWTINTVRFFGVICATLEKDFPNFDCSMWGDAIVNRIRDKMAGKPPKEPAYMFHCKEHGASLYDLLMYIDGKDEIEPTFESIEDLRMLHRMTTNYLPISVDKPGSMRFENLQNVTHVVIAALYYYAYNKYTLKRCKHCGRWFATQNKKIEYCDNISPCYGMVVAGAKVLGAERGCKEAVDIIKKRLAHRKKVIYDKWYEGQITCSEKCEECPYSECILDEDRCKELCDTYKQLKCAIVKQPSVENIVALHSYLYADDKPKQERPNRRKSNAFMRGLLGT